MLHTLSLTSFILIDHLSIIFDRGFHVLTGETGAGKTLLIQAIHLLTGKKVSDDLIRRGAEKAVIEATFQIDHLPKVHELLERNGIDFDLEELLIIRREVHKTSKNRIFINGQMAPLSLLSDLGPHLLELVGQNTSQSIRQADMQRELLDLYEHLQQEVQVYKNSYAEGQVLREKLRTLLEETKKKKLERLKWEWEEWEQLDYQEGEEESFFEEYKSLANAKESLENLSFLQQGLDHPSLIPTLTQFQKLSKDPTLLEHLKNAIIHLQEGSFLVSKKLNTIEGSPERFQELEERLTMLNRLKKKYRLESHEIPSYLEKLKETMDCLENLDEKIESLEREIVKKSEETLALAKLLSEKRKKGAQELSKALEKELQTLNFPNAKAPIHCEEKPIGPDGIDTITFLLAANKGEAPASLKDQSSGGEVARYLFALKILLATRAGLPTLIFDEIDANVGGETATLVGQKLKTLGETTQVLAITHFPQVARFADHHLHVSKNERDERTLTEIIPLTSKEKDQELLRMLGGTSININ
jgi:DNA repair protein RecN (Recombination protein N)